VFSTSENTNLKSESLQKQSDPGIFVKFLPLSYFNYHIVSLPKITLSL